MYTLSNPGEKVIFKFDKYTNVIGINDYSDDLSGTADVKKEFSYSYDGSIYSDWVEITNWVEPQVIPYIRSNVSDSPCLPLTIEDITYSIENLTELINEPILSCDDSSSLPCSPIPLDNVNESIDNIEFVVDEDILLCDDPCQILELDGIDENIDDIGANINEDILFCDSIVDVIKNTFTDFEINPGSDFYLKFKYTLISGVASVSKVILGLAKVENPNNIDNRAPYLSMSRQVNFSNRFGVQINQNPTLKIYKQNKAVDLHNRLSEATFNMVGHDSWYYRALPKKYGTDAFIHEHSKLHTDLRKCFKIMIPDNEFNQQAPAFDPFGVQFSDQLPFEIEINKSIFEKIYGKGSMPQRGDVIFIPIMNMIYEVQSTYLFREFMNEGVFYKVAIVKYQPSSFRDENVNIINDIEDSLNVNVPSAERLFGDALDENADRILNKEQSNIKTVDIDNTRLLTDHKMNIFDDDKIESYNVTISDTYYDLSSIHDVMVNAERIAVEYNGMFDPNNHDSYTYMSWFKRSLPSGKIGSITSFTNGQNDSYIITLNRNFSVLNISNGDEIQINNATKGISFIGIVNNIINNTATLIIDDKVKLSLLAQSSTWSSGTKTLVKASNLILIKATGLIIELVSDTMIRLIIGSGVTYIPISNIGNEWLGICVAFSNEFNQLSVTTWKPNTLQGDNNIINVDKILIEDFEFDDTLSASNFYLPTSFTKITNIRVFTEYVNYDNVEKMISRYVIDNAHHTIIVDNAINQLSQHYIGRNYQ